MVESCAVTMKSKYFKFLLYYESKRISNYLVSNRLKRKIDLKGLTVSDKRLIFVISVSNTKVDY